MVIRSFEDLEVYKLAREFSRKVGQVIRILPQEEGYNLKNQMRRAKLSVTNNIAEDLGGIITRRTYSSVDNREVPSVS